ncbi:MAG: tetratricopeptide repeat protein [Bacteroidetes bacterium]|nr:tetratricopeptide repeat protein [Bacteroidota bacterium]
MRLRIVIFLLAAVCLLLQTAGCGTRSIVVPVTHPASIDVHACGRVAVTRVQVEDGRDPLSPLIRNEAHAALLPMLQDGAVAEFVSVTDGPEPIVTPRGTLSLTAVADAAAAVDAACVLYCAVLESRYQEDVLQAEIRSSRNPGAEKRVRKGKASAAFRILVIDARYGEVTFADTLRLDVSHESHAVDEDPPQLDRAVFAHDLARRFASLVAEAVRPSEDHQVVTFLVDDAWPALEQAVLLAEQGRWQQAASIIRGLLDENDVTENRDILWYDLGLTLQYQQDFRAAKQAFDRALELHDRSRYHHAIDALLRMEDEYLERLRQQY